MFASDKMEEVAVIIGDTNTTNATDVASAFEKAKRALTEGKELIGRQQKLLKIADRAEGGWKVAKQYPIADNSDDEKGIRKAEKEVERRQGKDKKDKGKTQFFRGRRLYNASTPYYVSMGAGQHVLRPRGQFRKPGVCFACGTPGHFRKQCPYSTNGQAGLSNWRGFQQ